MVKVPENALQLSPLNHQKLHLKYPMLQLSYIWDSILHQWFMQTYTLDHTFTELLLESKTYLAQIVDLGPNWSITAQFILAANPKSSLIWSCSPI